MFGFFKRNKGNNSTATSTSSTNTHAVNTGGLNLSKQQAVETLNLRKETLGICLEKKNMNNLTARVGLVLDQTGSMRGLYRDGTAQEVVERLLPMGLKFDDNGELDMWIFSNKFKRLKSVTEEDFYNYVNREILDNPSNQLWGATYYAPVMRDVLQKYTQEEPSNLPTVIYFITDGENFDHAEAERIIRDASNYNIFWQFIGIGRENFKFLKKLDDMQGRFIDNADFFQLNDIRDISDEELYQRLLQEYPDWEREARQKGLIR